MATISLFKYNNYYNRILKRGERLADYGQPLNVQSNVNFNPNDGLSTELIINYEGNVPDYLLVTDDAGEIVSRWFILEARRTRAMQYHLSLLRDALAELKTEILAAPTFVEKGYVGLNDPAIFNNESMQFNQIKQEEQYIRDRSQSGWYVGYMARNTEDKEITVPKNPTKLSNTYATLEEYPYAAYAGGERFKGRYQDTTIYKILVKTATSTTSFEFGWDKDGNLIAPKIDTSPTPTYSFSNNKASGFQTIAAGPEVIADELRSALKRGTYNWSRYADILSGANTADDTSAFLAEKGKWYQINGKVYEVQISEELVRDEAFAASGTAAYQQFYNLVASLDGLVSTRATQPAAGLEYAIKVYTMTLVELTDETITFTIPANKAHVSDAPYDLFAIPTGRIGLSGVGETDPVASDAIVNEIIRELSKSIYDVQKLPYAPISDEYFPTAGTLDLTRWNNTEATTYYTLCGSASIIIYPTRSSFSKTLTSGEIRLPTTALEFKVHNETRVYRLCSPNYNGTFEFSPAKNGGVSGWTIAYTYKPYTPFVRVAPIFGRLYGRDFNDARGLVCGGDFSISTITDAWKTYQVENKNFQAIFDRQIENMEVNNSVQRTMDIVNAATGTAAGVVGGAIAGSTMGNPIAGAITGGVASAAGGVADVLLAERLRNEAIDFTKDQFGYNLQNIRALPYSLTKVGAQNVNYKQFPFVEIYQASELEEEALRNKIRYNGMTVMRIGTLNEYKSPEWELTYVKGRLIRLETIYEESHIVAHIANELNKGVFI